MTELRCATWHRLDHLATVLVTGPAAKSYLQGQLSFDLDRLSGARMELATCNSAQGRVQAVLWLIERSDALLLVLPASMLEATVARLKKYVLRAPVKIESGVGRFRVLGASDATLDVPAQAHREIDAHSYVRWPGAAARLLCIAGTSSDAQIDAAFCTVWQRADIAAGLPQVYPQTHEAFIAQMLNVDALGGIGFEKGCYTGQEIIARAHYRGTVKRRMLRYRAECAPPEPGTRLVVGEQHAGDVVDAAATSSGCELLAVVNLAQAAETLRISAQPAVVLEPLELPYRV